MKKANFVIKIVSLCFIVVLGVGLMAPLVVNADIKDDYETAQKELDAINKEIASLKDKASKQKAEIANAQKQIDLVKSQIKILNNEIESTGEDNW